MRCFFFLRREHSRSYVTDDGRKNNQNRPERSKLIKFKQLLTQSVRKMNRRLEQFLAAENVSQSEFADAIGVARASVSHILAGRNKPSYDFITSMMLHYPKLNMEWLLAGKGKMYKEPLAPAPSEPAAEEEEPQNLFTSTPQEAPIPAPEDIPTPDTPLPQTNPLPVEPIQKSDNQRKITKIIVLYDDNSFQELI